jgi:hypothetical protein
MPLPVFEKETCFGTYSHPNGSSLSFFAKQHHSRHLPNSSQQQATMTASLLDWLVEADQPGFILF